MLGSHFLARNVRVLLSYPMSKNYFSTFCERGLTILKFFKSLTLLFPIADEDRKSTYIFICTLLCAASKGFMKILKAFIKPFGAPERSENNDLS